MRKNYKHRLTGIVAQLPESYAALFGDLLEEVDEEVICNTYALPEPEVVVEEDAAPPVPVNTKAEKVFRSKEESND